MDPTTVAIVAFVAVFPMLALGVPIAFALAIVGIVGLIALNGLGSMMAVFPHLPYTSVAKYSYLVIPLFILAGSLADRSKFMEDMFWAVRQWLGHVSGGLAIVTVVACGIFAAISGSSIAATATMSRMAIPEMKKYNYRMDLASGCCAAGGPIAIMIPPSIVLVIYGMLTEQSIGRLLMAGFFPGVLIVILFCLMIYVRVRLNPSLGMPSPRGTWGDRIRSLRSMWFVLMIVLIVMGGLYTGIFTATEAAAVAALVTLIAGLALGRLKWSTVKLGMLETGYTTSMILIVFVGVLFFVQLLAFTGVPERLAEFITKLPVPRMGILVLVTIMYIFLGCFMEAMGLMTLTLPVIFPALVALGFDPIWFGVYIVLIVEMALLTPPVGMSVYTVKAVFPELSLAEIFKGMFPFFLMLLLALVIFALFPQIVLFLPNTMMRG